MNEHFQSRLTPSDSELVMMIESLVNCGLEIRNGGDCWFVHVPYPQKVDADVLAAIMAAIEGKAGNRLREIKDMPDENSFLVYVNFSEKELPELEGWAGDQMKPDMSAGTAKLYKGEIVLALIVGRDNIDRLIKFTGGGEMEIERRPGGKAVYHFVDQATGLMRHVPEGDYIVWRTGKPFEIVKKEDWIQSWK